MIQTTEKFGLETQNAIQQCRVCLEDMNNSRVYCFCRGNLSNIHEDCLIEWAKRTEKLKDSRNRTYMLCEICKSPIYLNIQRKYVCKKRDKLLSDFQKNQCSIIIVIAIFLLFLLILVPCSIALTNAQDSLILIIIVSISSFMMTLSLLAILKKAFIDTPLQITGIAGINLQMSISKVMNSYSIQTINL